MGRLIKWLSGRTISTLMLSCLYLFSVIFFHKEVSKISDWLAAKLSFKVYNHLNFLFSLVALVVFVMFIVIKMIKGEQRFLKIIYWVFTISLVIISYKMLVVFNVEIIHFPQYAILALPVFALLKRFGETVFWVTVAGAMDEAYQYFFLLRKIDVHFDFNDIILNLIGGGIGVVWIYTLLDLKPELFNLHENTSRKWNKFIMWAITGCVVIGGIILYAAGILQFYPEANPSPPLIVLSRVPPPTQFWINPNIGKSYHILHPIAGMVLTAALIVCYSLMDYRLIFRKKP